MIKLKKKILYSKKSIKLYYYTALELKVINNKLLFKYKPFKFLHLWLFSFCRTPVPKTVLLDFKYMQTRISFLENFLT